MEHRTKEFCKQCVRTLLSRYESLNTERAETELLFDDERMRYMAVSVGWMGHKRIHLCLVHIDIRDDLIVIQCNNTEDMIVTELVRMGIPRDKIRLDFVPPEEPRTEKLDRRISCTDLFRELTLKLFRCYRRIAKSGDQTDAIGADC